MTPAAAAALPDEAPVIGAAFARVDVLGVAIDRVDMPQTVAWIHDVVRARGYAQHMAVNAAKLVAAQDDPELREIIGQSTIVTADGQSVVWASRLLRDPLPCRVAGIDLMHELMALAAREGLRVYVLGAARDVLDQALERLRAAHPGLIVAGARDGYFPEEESATVAAEIRDARADLLFVAMSSPLKEYFLGTYGAGLGVPFVMGVGGSIDVAAGVTKRAPRVYQRLGLEWFYRAAQEPRRLGPRYLRTNGRFIRLVARDMVRRRRA